MNNNKTVSKPLVLKWEKLYHILNGFDWNSLGVFNAGLVKKFFPRVLSFLPQTNNPTGQIANCNIPQWVLDYINIIDVDIEDKVRTSVERGLMNLLK